MYECSDLSLREIEGELEKSIERFHTGLEAVVFTLNRLDETNAYVTLGLEEDATKHLADVMSDIGMVNVGTESFSSLLDKTILYVKKLIGFLVDTVKSIARNLNLWYKKTSGMLRTIDAKLSDTEDLINELIKAGAKDAIEFIDVSGGIKPIAGTLIYRGATDITPKVLLDINLSWNILVKGLGESMGILESVNEAFKGAVNRISKSVKNQDTAYALAAEAERLTKSTLGYLNKSFEHVDSKTKDILRAAKKDFKEVYFCGTSGYQLAYIGFNDTELKAPDGAGIVTPFTVVRDLKFGKHYLGKWNNGTNVKVIGLKDLLSIIKELRNTNKVIRSAYRNLGKIVKAMDKIGDEAKLLNKVFEKAADSDSGMSNYDTNAIKATITVLKSAPAVQAKAAYSILNSVNAQITATGNIVRTMALEHSKQNKN